MTIATSVLPSVAASVDVVDNHLCYKTPYGYYGVTAHAHMDSQTGYLKVRASSYTSAFTYYSTGTYCRANNTTLACPTTVSDEVWWDGIGVVGSNVVSTSGGIHTLGDSFDTGPDAGTFQMFSNVSTGFDNNCFSAAYNGVLTNWMAA